MELETEESKDVLNDAELIKQIYGLLKQLTKRNTYRSHYLKNLISCSEEIRINHRFEKNLVLINIKNIDIAINKLMDSIRSISVYTDQYNSKVLKMLKKMSHDNYIKTSRKNKKERKKQQRKRKIRLAAQNNTIMDEDLCGDEIELQNRCKLHSRRSKACVVSKDDLYQYIDMNLEDCIITRDTVYLDCFSCDKNILLFSRNKYNDLRFFSDKIKNEFEDRLKPLVFKKKRQELINKGNIPCLTCKPIKYNRGLYKKIKESVYKTTPSVKRIEPQYIRQCNSCKKLKCIKCDVIIPNTEVHNTGTVSHAFITCDMYQNITDKNTLLNEYSSQIKELGKKLLEDNSTKIEEEIIDLTEKRRKLDEEYKTELVLKKTLKCPCGVRMERISGCNTVKCTECNKTKCWLCNKDITLSPEGRRWNPHEHFSSGQCHASRTRGYFDDVRDF